MAITYTQLTSSFRTDHGAVDASPTLIGSGTNWRCGGGTFRFRVVLQVSGTGTPATTTWNLLIQKNGSGGYGALGGSTGIVASVSASTDPDQTAVTVQRLASGAGSWANGYYSTDGIVNSHQFASGTFTELEFGLGIDLANCVAGDFWDFRLYRGSTALTYTGTTIRLSVLKLDIAKGAFVLTGHSPAIGTGTALSTGSFGLTGNTASLTYGGPGATYTLSIASASFSWAIADLITRDMGMNADTNAFSLTGSSAGLTYAQSGSYSLTLDKGAFNWGIANLITREIVAPSLDTGTFSLSGQAAGLSYSGGYKINLDTGIFHFIGADGIRDYTLGVNSGSVALTGNAETLKFYNLPIATGTFALSGKAITVGTGFAPARGLFALTGNQLSIHRTYEMPVGSGTYILVGQDIGMEDLPPNPALQLWSGPFNMVGHGMGMVVTRNISLGSGSFAMSGTASDLAKSGNTITINPLLALRLRAHA